MSRKIIHLSLIESFGKVVTNETLCKKSQWQGGDGGVGGGMNVTINPKEVTCKLCLRELKKKIKEKRK